LKAQDGFAGALMGSEKRRDRIDCCRSDRTIGANCTPSDMRSKVNSKSCRRELGKQAHRQELLELRAPQTGIVKDLATHTVGTVVQQGTVLLTVVPDGERLKAEVWVDNQDIGFIRPGQIVRLQLAAFPFQRYGMIDGSIEHVGADSSDSSTASGGGERRSARDPVSMLLAYKALVSLRSMVIDHAGGQLALAPGMQTNAEILLGRRTVLEFLLSPVQQAFHEAARER
jgi:HlyD family secretion protein